MNIEYKIRINGKNTMRSYSCYKTASLKCHELICIAECMGRNSGYTIVEIVNGVMGPVRTPHDCDLTNEELELISNRVVAQLA
jgi:hypothetical protein